MGRIYCCIIIEVVASIYIVLCAYEKDIKDKYCKSPTEVSGMS